MRVVDTNVLAYFLIDGEQTLAARELHRRDPDWRSETFILIEFCNVLLRYMEVRGMKLETARNFLVNAELLLDRRLARISHQSALELAAEHHVTAYDARFLAFASELQTPLVTEDAKLRAAAPHLTQSITEALAALNI